MRPGSTALTAQTLRDFCAGTIAHYKIPRYVRVADEFPMTASGKIRKVALREQNVRELNLDDSVVTA